jgi:pimeloyl-ACP methyl ester carboxylesterase
LKQEKLEPYLKSLRKYGEKPFSVAVIHGGPGASGGMAPVARELSVICGTVEPLQTVASITGQLQELQAVLQEYADLPLTLIGHSWGAWLSFIFAAHYPMLVKKLILVGSGPFEGKYAEEIMETRIGRLSETERVKVQVLMETLNGPASQDQNAALAQFGKLMSKTDSFDPLVIDSEEVAITFQADIYQSVWQEASELRQNGELLKLGKQIRCPVVAIHGDYDPHPFAGVKKPLSQIVPDFHFVLLKNCGHQPWIERAARDRFYEILKAELK